MAPPETFVRDYFRGWNIPNFQSWQIGGEGFEFESTSSPKYLGDLTTTCMLYNELVAKMLLVDGPFFNKKGGWQNMFKSQNTILIENSFNNAREIFYNNYPGINVPMPHGLYLVKQSPIDSLHPAFVMNFIKNDFQDIDVHRQEVLLRRRDDMINIAEKRFDVGLGAHNPNNFIYSKNEDKIYLIGLSLWRKR